MSTAPTEPGLRSPQLVLPTPAGGYQTFTVWQTPVMEPGLAARLPEVYTLAGRSLDGRQTLRADLTPHGFHAMVLAGQDTWFIEPQPSWVGLSPTYAVFYKHDRLPAVDFHCATTVPELDPSQAKGLAPYPIGDVRRTYRLAVSATGEFTQFHGGTVDGALAAIATIVHRINGIYERDLAVRLLLVDSNHLLVFTDAATDPFSGGSGSRMGQNQQVVDSRIGSANYDLGHVFDRNGTGGIANLAAVCNNNRKAQGYTSTSPPEGDLFAIDYAAHEIGHQFGGNHTMGNCQNMNDNTAYEPGSGTTIMGYAGLCGNNNVALRSNDHFHVISLQEMTRFSILQNGNSCPQKDSTGNNPPVIESTSPAGLVLPIRTPFELTAVASDLQGDSLTYCWEQFDLGPTSPLGNPSGNAPSFRSFSPTPAPTRVFPRLSDLLANQTSPNEVLPTYSRALNFRLTVRDNFPGSGGVSWTEVGYSTTSQAGPFVVRTAAEPVTWLAGSFQVIEWDVARTNLAPVGADSVWIYLSDDGGFTYPHLLAEAPNQGQHVVQIPDSLSGEAFRIKVKGKNHVFFDLNNAPITIIPATSPSLAVAALPTAATLCSGNDTTYTFYITGLAGLTGTADLAVLGLPADIVATLSTDTLVLPGIVTANLEIPASVNSGSYPWSLLVTAQDTIFAMSDLVLEVVSDLPAAPPLVYPPDGEIDVPISGPFSWAAVEFADTYTFELATDPGFNELVIRESQLTDTLYNPTAPLPEGTALYWRVQANNTYCGAGIFTDSRTFSTERLACLTFTTENLPIPFSTSIPFTISRIEVPVAFPVRDVNVRNLRGVYNSDHGNLGFRIGGPGTPYFDLLEPSDCEQGGAFHFSFDDNAPAGGAPCPLDGNPVLRPIDPLSGLQGVNAQGTWRLYFYDGSSSTGELTQWEIELCGPEALVSAYNPTPTPTAAIRCFPQPTSGDLYLLPGAGLSGWWTLFDAFGRQVLRQRLEERTTVSLEHLPAGMYFYHWQNDANRLLATGKVIKQ